MKPSSPKNPLVVFTTDEKGTNLMIRIISEPTIKATMPRKFSPMCFQLSFHTRALREQVAVKIIPTTMTKVLSRTCGHPVKDDSCHCSSRSDGPSWSDADYAGEDPERTPESTTWFQAVIPEHHGFAAIGRITDTLQVKERLGDAGDRRDPHYHWPILNCCCRSHEPLTAPNREGEHDGTRSDHLHHAFKSLGWGFR